MDRNHISKMVKRIATAPMEEVDRATNWQHNCPVRVEVNGQSISFDGAEILERKACIDSGVPIALLKVTAEGEFKGDPVVYMPKFYRGDGSHVQRISACTLPSDMGKKPPYKIIKDGYDRLTKVEEWDDVSRFLEEKLYFDE